MEKKASFLSLTFDTPQNRRPTGASPGTRGGRSTGKRRWLWPQWYHPVAVCLALFVVPRGRCLLLLLLLW